MALYVELTVPGPVTLARAKTAEAPNTCAHLTAFR